MAAAPLPAASSALTRLLHGPWLALLSGSAFFMGGVALGQEPSPGAKHAIEVHRKFLAANPGVSAEDVPLLELTGSAKKAFKAATLPAEPSD